MRLLGEMEVARREGSQVPNCALDLTLVPNCALICAFFSRVKHHTVRYVNDGLSVSLRSYVFHFLFPFILLISLSRKDAFHLFSGSQTTFFVKKCIYSNPSILCEQILV
jgi:hypothetical protein